MQVSGSVKSSSDAGGCKKSSDTTCNIYNYF
jgi:hypothetical protein